MNEFDINKVEVLCPACGKAFKISFLKTMTKLECNNYTKMELDDPLNKKAHKYSLSMPLRGRTHLDQLEYMIRSFNLETRELDLFVDKKDLEKEKSE